jgi:hypothetical protein
MESFRCEQRAREEEYQRRINEIHAAPTAEDAEQILRNSENARQNMLRQYALVQAAE